jgi:FkbM family methyltransferase
MEVYRASLRYFMEKIPTTKQTETFAASLFKSLLHDFQTLSNPIPFRETKSLLDRARSRLKAALLNLARQKGFFWLERPERTFRELDYISGHLAEFQKVSDLLSDSYSKNQLVEALRLRVLGPYYVQATVGEGDYWDKQQAVEKTSRLRQNSLRLPGFPALNYYELPRSNRVLRCHSSPFGIATTFLIEQYAYRMPNETICARTGDVVVDGGGYLGETALYFGERVGDSGRVYTFEFNSTAQIGLNENLRLNPEIAPRVRVVSRGLWSTSGERLSYEQHGPGTTLKNASPSGENTATTITLDDFAKAEKLDRLDFVKMDIEGAELGALQGAVQVLEQFRPSLAIALYHDVRDFVEIPTFLASLNLGYRFFLRHAYVDSTETVLFATARNTDGAPVDRPL